MLYRATNNAKYLDYALYIVGQWSKHPEGAPDLLHKGLAGEPIHTWFSEPYEWAKSYEMVSGRRHVEQLQLFSKSSASCGRGIRGKARASSR